MSFLGLHVTALHSARQVIAQETRPGVLRLPLEEHVAIERADVGQEVGQGAANDDCLSEGPEALGDLKDALDLDDVTGNADERGVGEVIDVFANVLIAECYGEVGRGQSCEREEAQRWEDRLIRCDWQKVFQSPVGDGELRLNEINLLSGGPQS